jgi:hypothetical protein
LKYGITGARLDNLCSNHDSEKDAASTQLRRKRNSILLENYAEEVIEEKKYGCSLKFISRGGRDCASTNKIFVSIVQGTRGRSSTVIYDIGYFGIMRGNLSDSTWEKC